MILNTREVLVKIIYRSLGDRGTRETMNFRAILIYLFASAISSIIFMLATGHSAMTFFCLFIIAGTIIETFGGKK